MSYFRVFCRSRQEVSPVAIAEFLHSIGLPVEPHFVGDDLGWTSAELRLPGGGTPVKLHRYLTAEDELRKDLNTFAAELETMSFNPHHQQLMEHVVQSQQLTILKRPVDHSDEATLDLLCDELTRFLAQDSDSIYQIDGRGWFASNGELLLPEY